MHKRKTYLFLSLVFIFIVIAVISIFSIITIYSATGPICINEVMAVNESTITDSNNKYSDWIELYNLTNQPININGYVISDESASWIFPEGTIPAKGYLIVRASDEDGVINGELHTNFKISSSGETITITDTNGNNIDSLTTEPTAIDESYGRKTDGTDEFAIFSTSTPGQTNSNGITRLMEPKFSHEGGFYNTGFNLQLSTIDSEARIYYTTDGSDPEPGTAGTNEYSSQINIRNRSGDPNVLSMISNIDGIYEKFKEPTGEVFKCTNIKAISIANEKRSPIITKTYWVDPNMASRYKVPVISLVTDYDNLFDNENGIYIRDNYNNTGEEWERPMHFEFYQPDGTLELSQYIGVRMHGGASKTFPQKSFRLYADHGYDHNSEFKYEFFDGLTGKGTGEKIKSFSRILLRNSGNDWTRVMFRDAFMQSLVSHLNIDTQAYAPSVVFLNGEYWGLYNLRERFDNEFLASHYDLDKDRVAMLEFPVAQTGPLAIDVSEGTEEDADAFRNDFISYMESHSMTQKSNYDHIKTIIDMDNFIDYNIANMFYVNTDWPGNNTVVWKYNTDSGQYEENAPKGQDGKWRWMLKDTDFGYDGMTLDESYDMVNFMTNASSGFSFGNEGWKANFENAIFAFKTLLTNEEFRNAFINHSADQMNSSFLPSVANNKIDEFRQGIYSLMREHIDRWNSIRGPEDNATSDSSIEDWEANIEIMKDFANNRPGYFTQHILNHFSSYGINSTATVNLLTDSTMGHIKISSLDIIPSTPGVSSPSNWSGKYFTNVPIELKAISNEGYSFDHWEGVDSSISNNENITITLNSNITVTAVFKQGNTTNPELGDVNNDGRVNIVDALEVSKHVVGNTSSNFDETKADVNNDGQINMIDALLIAQLYVGAISEFPS